jgi:hypothetical protein
MAMTNYVDEDQNFPLRFTSQSQQNNVVSDNSLYLAESQWGYLILPGNNVAGKTNISLDFGTDPRSIAYMAWNYTPANNFFHNEIYRWQFVHITQPSYAQQVLEATTNMGAGIEEFGEPVSVAINAGEHSVLVTGVYSTDNVLLNFPAGITGVTYRDPQDGSHQTVDLNEWTNGVPYGYSLWSQYYGNPNDPEPGIGPYAPGARQVHWYQGFNWISRDNYYANGQYSPDWAFDSYNGAQLTTP